MLLPGVIAPYTLAAGASLDRRHSRSPATPAHARQVTKRVLFATAVVCCGCVLLVAFGNHESPTLSTHDLLELYSK